LFETLVYIRVVLISETLGR